MSDYLGSTPEYERVYMNREIWKAMEHLFATNALCQSGNETVEWLWESIDELQLAVQAYRKDVAEHEFMSSDYVRGWNDCMRKGGLA